jgi:ribonuclease HII
MVELIRTRDFDLAIIDCPGSRKMWWKCFADIMDIKKLWLEHKADVNFPLVSAASILAKSARDAHVDFLGVPGGGYSNKILWDYLDNYYDQHGALPSFVRFRWECVADFLERKAENAAESE